MYLYDLVTCAYYEFKSKYRYGNSGSALAWSVASKYHSIGIYAQTQRRI